MKKAFSILFIIFFVGIIGFNFKVDPYSETSVKNGFLNDYRIYALPIPDTLLLVDEPVPTHLKDVSERIDREQLVNTYWQSNALLMIKRKNKFFPIIEPILAQNGVPDDFKYLAVAESGLQNITSPAGAKGFWQIMKGTAKEYGLVVNKNIDERYNLEKATVAACKYLKNAKQKFGSWTLAAASYNAGVSRISKELAKQRVDNYYDLYLNEETSRYIPRIIMIKHLLSQPKKFGFVFNDKDLYTPYKYYEVEVDSTITDIARFAQELGTNYKEIKLLNPWLRSNTLPNKSKKTYFIKIKEQ